MSYKSRNILLNNDSNGMARSAIANKLGITEPEVRRLLRSGVKKLKEMGAFELILDTVHAVAIEERDLLQPGSVECRKDWIELFGDMYHIEKEKK